MQRQKSIRSFFQKPSPAGNGASQPLTKHKLPSEPDAEVRGTDTPPEKVPRQILPASFAASGERSSSSLFSSIAHKFARVDEKGQAPPRDQVPGPSNACSVPSKCSSADEYKKQGLTAHCIAKDDLLGFKGGKDQTSSVIIEDDDVLGPETPGARPFVPRLKRVQEEVPSFSNKGSTLLESSKRLKLVEDSTSGSKNHNETDIASKFEWLNPAQIKDANGRRPSDPLFDKKTLFIPPDALRKMSASQKQYWSVKCNYMDVIIFFKVGKFYELYELDAEIGHKELDWKLTVSGVGKCRQVGVSESGIDDAVQKLIARGYKVGRMEQLESSEQAKARGANSVIQRKLVQVFTPSTSIDDTIGPDAVHLLVIREGNIGADNGSTVYGFAFVDCAALRFWIGSINDDASCASLGALLMQVSPKEVVYENQGLSKEAQKALRKYSVTGSTAVQLTPTLATTDFSDATDVRNLIVSEGYFKRSSNSWANTLDETADKNIVLGALGGLISHLSRLMLDDVLRNGDLFPYQVYKGCLRMDGQTLLNLEIFNNNADGGHEGTLFKYLDNCMTSSGRRLLRNWLCHPLKDVSSINCRLDVVENLMDNSEVTSIISQYLRRLPDLERLLGRVKASAQSSTTLLLPVIGKKLLKQRVKAFGTLVKGLRLGIDLLQLLQKEGDVMPLLLKLFNLPVIGGKDGLSEFLSQFEAAIESDFPNYQNHDPTDADAEILLILIELLIEKGAQLSEVIHGLNCIDVLRAFAVTASSSSGPMTRPVILPPLTSLNVNSNKRGPILKTERLWHPFALGLNGELPVPNDTFLGEDTDDCQPCSLLLTGPNMGGKSTLLRSICLAVILSQVGCYVPSKSCVLSVADRIFTRLGATDRIMTGESTFLVECTETAAVLQNATRDSLVLLDELGRGTSTFDGYAIAFAVFRHLVEKVNCRLLFATHYHPLTKEFASHPRVKLQHMACAFKSKSGSPCDKDEELVFLYRLADGACPESYGLQVAAMAGIPEQVVRAAMQAAGAMKRQVGESFRSSERRSEFSTLHEEWLRTLIGMASIGSDDVHEEDVYDTFFCLWHELKGSYKHK